MSELSSKYHNLAAQGVSAHIKGDYGEALRIAEEIHRVLTGQDFSLETAEQQINSIGDPIVQDHAARNVRNIGARYERLGDNESAHDATQVAADVHQKLLDQNEDSAELGRELSADRFYLGSLAMKAAMLSEMSGEEVDDQQKNYIIEQMRKSYKLLGEAAEVDGNRHHQYLINGIGRFSVAEALYGERSRGLELGMKAVWQALFSEPERRAPERAKAISKALIRGIGATGVNTLSLIGARKTAVRITQKLL